MNIGMRALGSSIPFIATLLFITHSALCQMIQGHKFSIERQFHEYKAMLKNENKTGFPERDIRSLLNPGLKLGSQKLLPPSLSQRQSQRQQTGIIDHSQLSTDTSDFDAPFPSKKGPSRRQRKKWKNSKRKQRITDIDIPNLMSDESNELEAENLDKLFPQEKISKKSKRPSGRRKDRRRKNRRRRIRQRKMKSSKSSVVVTHISNLPPLKERCKTRPMKQEIKIKGCTPKIITNNFCYGQCNSYFIPETQGRGDGPPAFVSCGFCRPRTIRPIIVQLRCTGRNGHTRRKRKKVPYIKKCRCMAQPVTLDFL